MITNENGFRHVAENCKELVKLYLEAGYQWIDDKTLQLIALGFPKLTHLTLRFCKEFSDAAFQLFCENCASNNLVQLHISTRKDWISDQTLEVISEHLQNLQDLDLWNCFNVSNDGLQHLGELRSLRRLLIQQTDTITIDGLQHLLYLPYLQQVKIPSEHVTPKEEALFLKQLKANQEKYF